MALTWTTDVTGGAWLAERIVGFGTDVGSVVPYGFEAYARVFHPLDEGPSRRWADLAARNGRIAHPEMQLHLIASPPGTAPEGDQPLDGASVGSLPSEELAAVVDVLGAHTGTPDRARFAVWDGWACLHGSPAVVRYTLTRGRAGPVPPLAPPEVLGGPRLELSNRSYVLLQGAVADAIAVADLLHGQSPNLWWPDERTWCVATEIDLACSYVAGSAEAVAAVLACPALEALPAQATDGITWDSDHLNSALDQEA